MKVKLIKKFCDKKNWKLSKELYNIITETICDGGSINKGILIEDLNEVWECKHLVKELKALKIEDIKAEIIVRSLIEGWGASYIINDD